MPASAVRKVVQCTGSTAVPAADKRVRSLVVGTLSNGAFRCTARPPPAAATYARLYRTCSHVLPASLKPAHGMLQFVGGCARSLETARLTTCRAIRRARLPAFPPVRGAWQCFTPAPRAHAYEAARIPRAHACFGEHARYIEKCEPAGATACPPQHARQKVNKDAGLCRGRWPSFVYRLVAGSCTLFRKKHVRMPMGMIKVSARPFMSSCERAGRPLENQPSFPR